MNFIIRKATEEDFPEILDLVKGLAIFQNSLERVTNTVEQILKKNICSIALLQKMSIKKLWALLLILLSITHGLANHFILMICM